MKNICLYVILLSAIIMGIFYINAIFELFLEKRYYEGYVFGLPIIIYDFLLIIPVFFVIAKGSDEARVWVILTIFLNNLIMFLPFKMAAIIGLGISVFAILFFLARRRQVMKNKYEL